MMKRLLLTPTLRHHHHHHPSSSTAALKSMMVLSRPSSFLGASSSVAGTTNRHHYFATTTTTNKKDNNDSSSPPFNKILIANRGEISQRIVRTCQKLGVKTVAIYSTADAKAPFVQAADEAICVGPAASNLSYLKVDNVIEAIRTTHAEAVHPGYGFLSENAGFCNTIEELGVAWLGPPVSAMAGMGDKLQSKLIAEEAGVTIIPGYDGDVESVEHALQIAHDIGYPILLKAVAGGGGKGMRTCYNDRDVEEAYRMSKAEAKNYFNDDRLLVEKYIVNPHHIEFQVLCSPPAGKNKLDTGDELQVVVFPERECSIQRRNQKVIEESPSVLLTEATRRTMVEQVKRLCKTVGYISAGTVEWLVDEEQNFYFLEMNTRLQVEHPITEAITGVDLVKGMLYIAAGRGLPEEYHEYMNRTDPNTVMPHKGHAVEARIYAEDPLRGFLPSTGPLVPYVEPPTGDTTSQAYLRMDSGVAQGHVVTPFYDPMLAKVIYYGPTRKEAIVGLAEGLDRYVIEGVQHNARFVNAVLRHDVFQAGRTPTSFLKEHFPDFTGVPLTNPQKEELALAVALIGVARDKHLGQHTREEGFNEFVKVVRLGGMFGAAYRVSFLPGDQTATVQQLASVHSNDTTTDGIPRTITMEPLQYEPEKYLATATLDGVTRALQVIKEDSVGHVKIQMYGADMPCLIQSPREFELTQYMHAPVKVDTSDFVMSPMPGTLIGYSVKEGDSVELDQELCIVEAMKMQNIVRSPKAGIISKLRVKAGASLMADEIILEFEVESSDDEEAEKKKAA